ncbi:MAG TPA: hypothetical protein VFU69_07720, partial [Ktedonobacterales bacterium]|nr:hypothetical protein [Ktedonobacterales bacterium]
MAQWEMCCAASVSWKSGVDRDHKLVVHWYVPTGVITRFPPINGWGELFAVLGAAGWEAITVQHGLYTSYGGGSVR